MKNFIDKIINYMISNFLKESNFEKKVTEPTLRKKFAYLESWVSIISNLILAILKVIMGLALNSISLLADAAHTSADV